MKISLLNTLKPFKVSNIYIRISLLTLNYYLNNIELTLT